MALPVAEHDVREHNEALPEITVWAGDPLPPLARAMKTSIVLWLSRLGHHTASRDVELWGIEPCPLKSDTTDG